MSPETGCVESPRLWWGASVIVVEFLDGLGGEVVEVFVRALGVEPLHPVRGGHLDLVDIAPGALPVDELVLKRPDRRLGQRVVQRIANRSDRRIDTFVDEPSGERHRRVLAARIAVGDQPLQGGVAFLGAG